MAGGGSAIAAVSRAVQALVEQPILTVIGTKRGDGSLHFIDAREPFRWASIRGRLAEVIADPEHAFIDRLAQRYTGREFRELRPGEERITLKIEPVSVTGEMI